MPTKRKLIPIYTSHGSLGAYLVYPYLYSPDGEWIGWVNAQREVFSVHGQLAGTLTSEPRILRQREWTYDKPREQPPPAPALIRPPAHAPLAPPMAEHSNNLIDVLENASRYLPPVDFGELRQDLD